MKKRQMDHGWSEKDETEFTKKLEAELIKVYTFIENGLNDLNQQVNRIETSVCDLMEDSLSVLEQYNIEADSLTEALFECNDLAKFLHINATGFQKIIKKHDRYTNICLDSIFQNQTLAQWSLDHLSLKFDVLVVKISVLHDTCQLQGKPRQPVDRADQTAFERATAKYWVHPDHITEVKAIILFHLPVHIYSQTENYQESDMAVSSVYFDNDELDLYTTRLEREPGAESIRLRWYGANQEEIYVERKTHKASWLDGKSVKDRFRIKQGLVNDYLAARYTADNLMEDIRIKPNGKTRSQESLEEHHFVASGIQNSVQYKKLKPMCRVFYNRTAFQLPGDQRLRISLDANLTFIREQGRAENHWKRGDIDIDYPFQQVEDQDILRFPYAILETKLQTHLGQETPAWLTALLDSHLVYEVPRFSKYIHGAAILFKDKISVDPYWLEDFSKDIRKKSMANIGLTRSQSSKPLINGHHRQSLLSMYEKELESQKTPKTKNLTNLFTLTGTFRKSTSSQNDGTERKKGVLNSTVWSGAFLKKKQKDEESILPRVRGGLVKKTEPKTFFANERTFISWLQFCALLLTVALNLLNNGDTISRGIGATFIIIGAVLCLYALFRYQIRSYQLRTHRNLVRYDDIWGPTILCILLVTALIVNFYLRFNAINTNFKEPIK
ncbi:VTC domain-containing protein [Sporodiniella umbellata]|nr:VTC domain-containing protein [Sporodiniella umbellata]